MQTFNKAILTHGGAGSNTKNSDGPFAAAGIGMELMAKGESALTAVVRAVRHLEADPRFNAGIGSHLRADGATVQMDASCMVSSGEFGAVGCLEGMSNPIEVAREVLLFSPHILLVGDGARQFAKEHNIPVAPFDLPPGQMTSVASVDNVPPSCDTVGAIAFDGTTFAAALSTGGRKKAALGRVGDVPLPGCGLFCGPAGAVACTGVGEAIALKILAREVYGWLEQGLGPGEAAEKALTLIDSSVDLGVLVLTASACAARSRNGMAWAQLTE